MVVLQIISLWIYVISNSKGTCGSRNSQLSEFYDTVITLSIVDSSYNNQYIEAGTVVQR